MRSFTLVLVAIGLLTQACALRADPMLIRPRSLGLQPGTPATGLDRWTVSLQATSWDVPDNVNAGVRVEVETEIRPVGVVEYRLNNEVSVGGWYNPIKWHGSAVDPATGARTPAFTLTGAVFEAYGTYSLPGDFAVQLAYQRLQGNSSVPGDPRKHPDELHWLGVWGMKSVDLSGVDSDRHLGLMLSAGFSAPLSVYTISKSQGATMLNGMVGLSYALTPGISIDGSAWILNVTGKTSRTRFNGGVTGRF